MQTIPFLIFLLCFIFYSFPSPPLAHGQLLPIVDDVSGGDPNRIQTYIVHVLKPNNTHHFLTGEDRENWHRSFLPSALLDSGEPRMIYSYKHAISGFAARLTPKEVRAMEAMNGFLGAHPEERYEVQTTHTPAFLGLSRTQGLWPDSKFGQGMIIGVIDSGIFPSHPSFHDANMPPPPTKWKGRCDFGPGVCNNKLIGARAFQSGASPPPFDDNGHGTHVASTAAGNAVDNANVLGQAAGTAVGIAPGAHLAIYKVVFEGSDAGEADFLAGIDQAIEDGVDVLSMSLGSLTLQELYQSGVLVGSMAAFERGIFASVAGGNDGPTPSDIRNDAPWVLTVGASTTDRRISSTVRLGNGVEIHGESAFQPDNWLSPPMEIVYPGANNDPAFIYCSANALAGLNVLNKVVLCRTGEISDIDKGVYVKNAGGAAMIVLNDVAEALATDAAPHVLPASHLDSLGTKTILNYVASSPSGASSATIIFHGTQLGATPTPAVGSFSSRGPSTKNGGIIKPDIVGPGANILAAWPVPVGPVPPASPGLTFNFYSGTSMATPHLSGIAAMLKAIHPQWSPAAIKSAIMTTAHSAVTDQHPDTGPAASYFAMGAGHVDVAKASNPGLIYDTTVKDYISYICGLQGYTSTQLSIIFQRQVRCPGRPMRVENLNYPSISLTLDRDGSKTVIRDVTNVGDANSVYDLRISMKQEGIVEARSSRQQLSFTSIGEKIGFVLQFVASGTYPGAGAVVEGQLLLVSGEREVRSPISITFN